MLFFVVIHSGAHWLTVFVLLFAFCVEYFTVVVSERESSRLRRHRVCHHGHAFSRTINSRLSHQSQMGHLRSRYDTHFFQPPQTINSFLFDAISITLVDQIPSSPSSACRLSSVFFGRRTDRGDHRNVDDDAYLNRHGQALAKRH